MAGILAAAVLALFSGHARDRTPPVFAGLKSATTCLAGPSSGKRTSRYRLAWRAASDNRTPRRRIVYEVYMSTAHGGERFGHPTWTTRAGATAFVTPPLSSAQTYWFVVRARDRAGNQDRNRHEVVGVNVCV